MDNNGNLFNQVVNDTQEPARNYAVASLVLGILALALPIVASFFGASVSSAFGLTMGIVGACLSGAAKKKGNFSGMRKAGMVLSIIAIVVNCLGVACVGCGLCAVCTALPALMAV